MLTVGGLFSGIGGWELGLERAGFDIAWHCEADQFCRAVLTMRWPDVPCYEDVRELRGVDVEPVDVLCGGFPCQDISVAGLGAGIRGARSGLWREFARLVGELRPRYVLIENVAALTSRGLDVVLGDLAARGFDAEWDCLPASTFGAPHRRDRVWIVAYPSRDLSARTASTGAERERDRASGEPCGVGDATGTRLEGANGRESQITEPAGSSHWLIEPDVGRVADGVPQRVDRLRSLGNALVPQISEWIGRRIVEWEGQG